MHAIVAVAAPRVVPEELRDADEERSLLARDAAVFTTRLDAGTRVRAGDRLRLGLDPRALHFFDCETGVRLAARDAAPLVANPG